ICTYGRVLAARSLLDYNSGTTSSRILGVPEWPHRHLALSPAWPMASVSCHAWLGILGTSWRCADLPRSHEEAMEPKRAGALIPMHGSQLGGDFTPIWPGYSCRTSPMSNLEFPPFPPIMTDLWSH